MIYVPFHSTSDKDVAKSTKKKTHTCTDFYDMPQGNVSIIMIKVTYIKVRQGPTAQK